MKFEIGSVVWLKSGGTAMTVIGIIPLDAETFQVECAWFANYVDYRTCRVNQLALTDTPKPTIRKTK